MSAWAISTLTRLVRDLDVFRDGRSLSADVLDAYEVSLELVYREIIVHQSLGESDENMDEACELVRSTLCSLAFMKDVQNRNIHIGDESRPPIVSRTFGRPRFDMKYEQLSFLLENRFTVNQIAEMLGVSERTVYRRMSVFSLSVRILYSNICDDDLDYLVSEIQSDFPMCGNVQMQGHLLAHGYRVQQIRVRECMRRVDPEGCVMRRLQVMNRHQYRVPAPLSLWHLDGNHKLIR